MEVSGSISCNHVGWSQCGGVCSALNPLASIVRTFDSQNDGLWNEKDEEGPTPSLKLCPLFPRKRTNSRRLHLSALCQKRTYAPQQNGCVICAPEWPCCRRAVLVPLSCGPRHRGLARCLACDPRCTKASVHVQGRTGDAALERTRPPGGVPS